MANPSIKSLIVDALIGKIDMMRVKREFILEKFIKRHKPVNLRGISRSHSPVILYAVRNATPFAVR